jgi:hypothetical protein
LAGGAVVVAVLPAPGALTGTVRNSETNAPIAGATVDISLYRDRPQFPPPATPTPPSYYQAKTDINGAFSFDLPRFGTVALEAKMDGFLPDEFVAVDLAGGRFNCHRRPFACAQGW